jgi:phosphate transport system permease protein
VTTVAAKRRRKAAVRQARQSSRPPKKVKAKGIWSVGDRIGLGMAWVSGILLCVIAASITIFMAWKGVQYVTWDVITSSPEASLEQSKTGGFLDPIIGTLLLTVLGGLIATPVGVAVALWLTEYGRPSPLARFVEAGVEVIAGTPSIVLAIFGLLIYQQGVMAPFSFTADGGEVFGRSFFAAGAAMSLIALPFVVGGTREGLNSIPKHIREASYALGKDKASTIRRVLLPSARRGIATGSTLGIARIAGDTAVVVVLLGASLQIAPEGNIPGIDVLKGTGSTLTSYVYQNSPAGEGNAPEKAYAAAFVLLLIIILLNLIVNRIAKKGQKVWG